MRWWVRLRRCWRSYETMPTMGSCSALLGTSTAEMRVWPILRSRRTEPRSRCRIRNNRPPNAALRRFVGHLANTWCVITSKRFTNEWHHDKKKGIVPISLGAQFVHAVVESVAPASLDALLLCAVEHLLDR